MSRAYGLARQAGLGAILRSSWLPPKCVARRWSNTEPDVRKPMTTELYVQNVQSAMTDAELQELFERAGFSVADVDVPRNRATQLGRGFAFVEVGSGPGVDLDALIMKVERPLQVSHKDPTIVRTVDKATTEQALLNNRMVAAETADELLALADNVGFEAFTEVNAATFFARLAATWPMATAARSDKRVSGFVEQVHASLKGGEWVPSTLTSVAFYLSKLGCATSAILHDVVYKALPKMENFRNSELISLVSALSLGNMRDSPLFEVAAERFLRDGGTFLDGATAPGLVKLLRAYSAATVPPETKAALTARVALLLETQTDALWPNELAHAAELINAARVVAPETYRAIAKTCLQPTRGFAQRRAAGKEAATDASNHFSSPMEDEASNDDLLEDGVSGKRGVSLMDGADDDRMMDHFAAHELALLCRAVVWSNVGSWEFFKAVEDRALMLDHDELLNLPSKFIGALAWSLASAKIHSPVLFAKLHAAVAPRIESLKEKDVALLAWAYMKVAAPREAFQPLARQARIWLHDGSFSPKGMATVAHAFAAAKVGVPDLFDAVAVAAAPRLGQMTEMELSNLAWAFATARHPAPALLEGIAEHAVTREIVDMQHLTELVWAYGVLNLSAPQLMARVAKEAPKSLHTASPIDLTNLAWSFGKLPTQRHKSRHNPKKPLFTSIAHASLHKMDLFEPRELSNLSLAFWRTGLISPDLFNAVCDASRPKFQRQFSSIDFTNLLWAMANAAFRAPNFFEAALQHARPNSLGPGLLPMVALAVCFASALSDDGLNSAPIAAWFEDVATVVSESEPSGDLLHQWHLVCVYLRTLERTHPLLAALEPHEAQMAMNYTPVSPSPVVRGELANSLQRISAPGVVEHFRTAEGTVINCALPDARIAVEFYSPRSYLQNLDRPKGAPRPHDDLFLNGRALFDRRVLHNSGWQIVQVPYYEWDALESNAAQDEYLVRRLHTLFDGI
ncbi:hypothetical protein M885DRAFT_625674 [Pelagophyceae sp. CCMP2097]|nr:hypothetical protein M885DRAFT_625674 [Pelagophyceae sp. CCMP2097]